MTIPGRAEQPVLAGVDGSRSAGDAVRWAAHEAQRRGTSLRLVEALGWVPAAGGTDEPHVEPSYRDVLIRTARERLAGAAALAATAAPQVAVRTDVLDGYPIPRLVVESRTAQLVVVGDRGLAAITGMLIGSVASGLAAHADCPTVVVRGAEPGGPVPTDGPVVVGVDGSPTSAAAVAFAFDAAAARHTALVAVHTWRDVMIDPMVAQLVDWAPINAREDALLAERLAALGVEYPDVEVRRVVAMDRPARVLRACSVGAQLLVVGSRGRGGVAGAVLGSVSQSLLHHAACPVAVVRPDTAANLR